MAKVILENISKSFGTVQAVKDFNLTIDDKEFAILVGPSGCGKSTALRMVAGLEEPTTGTIYIGDRAVTDLPPKDRDIAMVFQEYALYPHMSVYKNMAFGLKLRKFPKEEINQRVREFWRRSRLWGTFSDRTSMERILYSVFTHGNLKQGTATPFLLLTQNN
jgi:multiple sugar transport system ATP-binding protein